MKLLSYSTESSYWATGWAARVQFSSRTMTGFFSLSHRVQTDSGTHLASYPTGAGSTAAGT